ncbi:MAG: TolC family protein [Desulfobacterales bacterium]|jgi:TolC family type I secretion outer membrane protein|nr:TolC family protein [Desulfobacterales bacterium]
MRWIRFFSGLVTLMLNPVFTCFALESASALPAGITLEASIAEALKKNPQIVAAQARVSAAEHRHNGARSGFFPRINASETYQRTTNPMWAFGIKLNQQTITREDFNPDLLNDPSVMDNYASQVWLTWPLYDSGQTWYAWRQADMARQSEEAALARTRQEVIAKTVAAYTDLVMARHSVAVVDQAISTARAHLAMIEKRYENGLAVKSDVLRTRVHIAELEQDKVNADSRLSVAESALNAVMGEDMSLRQCPQTPLSKMEMEAKELNAWIDVALAHRPDLIQLSFQEKMADSQISKSKSAYLPSVSLNGGYEWDTEDFSDMADNYSVGASVTMNLFSGGQTVYQAREAVSRRQEIRAQLQAMKQQVRLDTEQAYRDVLSAEKRIAAASAAVDLSDEALRIVRNRYDSGLIPLVSLLDAELALYRSNNNYYQALKDHMQARARLGLAAGKLDEGFK